MNDLLRGTRHARYVRLVVLLAECAPYVDDPDLIDIIDELMAEVARDGLLECRRNGTRWEIALPRSKER